ncbi:class I SAM-dependent methyltransferase [Micromonospora sp. BRA006-A]|nr:class I SAM-dependent methyltransferase [Micromonospora sp. BRA006-A]
MLRDNDGSSSTRCSPRPRCPSCPRRPDRRHRVRLRQEHPPAAGQVPDRAGDRRGPGRPGLRLAHAEAEATGVAIDYRQADGRATGIESDSCDVVTGTMVLHEMPAAAIRETILEAARLLKPGGSLRFLEFMLTGDRCATPPSTSTPSATTSRSSTTCSAPT